MPHRIRDTLAIDIAARITDNAGENIPGRRRVKLATFRSGGREKIALVHGNDSRLFDLAAAADRAGKASAAFASMLALIDAGPAALDQARTLFDRSGSDESLSIEVAGAEILAPLPQPRQ